MPFFPARCISNGAIGLAVACVIAGAADRAEAHAVYQAFVKHDVRCEVGPENIDVTVELTFYEFPSIAERRRMDADHDGTIGDDEVQRYLAEIADTCADDLAMTVAGRPVDVIVLHEPRLDLFGVRNTMPAHHILRLYYFARTPEWLERDSAIEIRDGLWPGVPAMESCEASGHGGVTLRLGKTEKKKQENPAEQAISQSESIPARATPGTNGIPKWSWWLVPATMLGLGALLVYRSLKRQTLRKGSAECET